VPKHDGGQRRIHDLSYPRGKSVNDDIPAEYGAIEYVTFDTILTRVRQAGYQAMIIKRDIKAAFRMVPVALDQRHLLGLEWQGRYYMENRLPFGLRTSPVLFNLFAEALHWLLELHLQHELDHYLDDFIFILKSGHPTAVVRREWLYLTTALGIPRNDGKDTEGTVIEVLGIIIDTEKMEARLSVTKVERTKALINDLLLHHRGASFAEIERLGGLLSWAARVIYLGRTFTAPLWTFLATYPPARLTQHRRRMPLDLIEDLKRWLIALTTSNGIRIIEPASCNIIHLFTDASDIGLGAFWYEQGSSNWRENVDRVPFDQSLSQQRHNNFHINVAEVQAVLYALQRWHSR
jgi:hypothetical protein